MLKASALAVTFILCMLPKGSLPEKKTSELLELFRKTKVLEVTYATDVHLTPVGDVLADKRFGKIHCKNNCYTDIPEIKEILEKSLKAANKSCETEYSGGVIRLYDNKMKKITHTIIVDEWQVCAEVDGKVFIIEQGIIQRLKAAIRERGTVYTLPR